MFLDKILLVIVLLFVVSLLSMVSSKLKISYPIFLVIAGLLISLFPDVPAITFDPDLVFLIFLPPLLYSAAWNTSWKQFWHFRRFISFLAFGLVLFTAGAVAITAQHFIPGFTLALGFLLGGIVSPPDAIAATSVLQQLSIPRPLIAILEGESLLNDASSLIVFRFALATILTGHFALGEAGVDFLLVVFAGIAVGLAIAVVLYLIHKYLPTTPSIDTGLTLITPYIMYIVAEHFHFSGVLAVVSGGLFLSGQSSKIFSYQSRMDMQSFWNTIGFLFNGTVFILIGLQLPVIVGGMERASLGEAIRYGLLISLVTILVRIIWVFPATYVPMWLSKKIKQRNPVPSWRMVFLVAWSGMRGVVSLAAALSVPLMISGTEAFPQRNMILFITFVVILVTLVLQGLSLPVMIKALGIRSENDEEAERWKIDVQLAEAVTGYLVKHHAEDINRHEIFHQLHDRYSRVAAFLNNKLEGNDDGNDPLLPSYRNVLITLIQVRRNKLEELKKDKQYSDELLRSKENELDHEEARLS